MKAVIAIDSFKGSMDSIEAGEAAEKGIRRVFTDAEAIVYPLADGGEGTVQALAKGLGGKLEKVKVTGPLGEPVICEYGIVEEKTAIIEMAGAAGITLVQPKLRNPLNTTTYGVGEVIKDAIGKGCRHFIIGIGGSATNDGGIGMLQALGAEFLDEGGKQVPFGARGVEKLASINCEHILFELKECDFRIACDVDNPTPRMAEQMDQWMRKYAKLTEEYFQMAGTRQNYDSNYPGCGAAGGLGFAFRAFLRGKLEPGINIVLEEIGIETAIKDADIVITGEGCLDGQTVMGKAPIGIARLAKKYGKPVIAFSGAVTEDAAACNQAGIDAFFPILRQVTTLEAAMSPATAIRNMTAAVEQTFRLLKMSFIYGKEFKMYSVSPLDFSHKQE